MASDFLFQVYRLDSTCTSAVFTVHREVGEQEKNSLYKACFRSIFLYCCSPVYAGKSDDPKLILHVILSCTTLIWIQSRQTERPNTLHGESFHDLDSCRCQASWKTVAASKFCRILQLPCSFRRSGCICNLEFTIPALEIGLSCRSISLVIILTRHRINSLSRTLFIYSLLPGSKHGRFSSRERLHLEPGG